MIIDQKSKNAIIKIFMQNVYGRKPEVNSVNIRHDGKYGHWLETQMGITHNANNEPDLLGFEMKNDTSSKTTFGDWSPDQKIFGKDKPLSRADFIKIFGHPSEGRKGRWSWSGKPVPKIGRWNEYGQTLEISPEKHLQVIYDFYNDGRPDKHTLVPKQFQKGQHILLQWSHDVLKQKVERKFNQNGWFKCLTDKNGVYNRIVFGAPLTFDLWLEAVRQGVIFLDSGMYHDENKPNTRPYMQWRANNDRWANKIIDEYPRS